MSPMKSALRYTVPFVVTVAVATPVCAKYEQNGDHFRAALLNDSTAPSFVLITVKNGRDGSAKTGCTEAPFLLGAIHKENAIPHDEAGDRKTLEIALSAKGHTFTFRNPAALSSIAFDNPRYRRACEIIYSGKQAYITDITGEVREGNPGYPLPGVVR
jgi:hypothetical protein